MMQPPPSRYKVVERGRRLEVIDTRTGKPASSVPLPLAGGVRGGAIGRGRDGNLTGPPPTPPASGRGAQAGSAGLDSDTFVTKRWFDDKAPRTIRLNYANRARLLNLRWIVAVAIALLVVLSFWFWPLAILLVFAVAFGPKLRAQLRVASTRWLDGLDQAA
jgi:hypothetical protein